MEFRQTWNQPKKSKKISEKRKNLTSNGIIMLLEILCEYVYSKLKTHMCLFICIDKIV